MKKVKDLSTKGQQSRSTESVTRAEEACVSRLEKSLTRDVWDNVSKNKRRSVGNSGEGRNWMLSERPEENTGGRTGDSRD